MAGNLYFTRSQYSSFQDGRANVKGLPLRQQPFYQARRVTYFALTGTIGGIGLALGFFRASMAEGCGA